MNKREDKKMGEHHHLVSILHVPATMIFLSCLLVAGQTLMNGPLLVVKANPTCNLPICGRSLEFNTDLGASSVDLSFQDFREALPQFDETSDPQCFISALSYVDITAPLPLPIPIPMDESTVNLAVGVYPLLINYESDGAPATAPSCIVAVLACTATCPSQPLTSLTDVDDVGFATFASQLNANPIGCAGDLESVSVVPTSGGAETVFTQGGSSMLLAAGTYNVGYQFASASSPQICSGSLVVQPRPSPCNLSCPQDPITVGQASAIDFAIFVEKVTLDPDRCAGALRSVSIVPSNGGTAQVLEPGQSIGTLPIGPYTVTYQFASDDTETCTNGLVVAPFCNIPRTDVPTFYTPLGQNFATISIQDLAAIFPFDDASDPNACAITEIEYFGPQEPIQYFPVDGTSVDVPVEVYDLRIFYESNGVTVNTQGDFIIAACTATCPQPLTVQGTVDFSTFTGQVTPDPTGCAGALESVSVVPSGGGQETILTTGGSSSLQAGDYDVSYRFVAGGVHTCTNGLVVESSPVDPPSCTGPTEDDLVCPDLEQDLDLFYPPFLSACDVFFRSPVIISFPNKTSSPSCAVDITVQFNQTLYNNTGCFICKTHRKQNEELDAKQPFTKGCQNIVKLNNESNDFRIVRKLPQDAAYLKFLMMAGTVKKECVYCYERIAKDNCNSTARYLVAEQQSPKGRDTQCRQSQLCLPPVTF